MCESKMGLGMFYMKSWEVNRQQGYNLGQLGGKKMFRDQFELNANFGIQSMQLIKVKWSE